MTADRAPHNLLVREWRLCATANATNRRFANRDAARTQAYTQTARRMEAVGSRIITTSRDIPREERQTTVAT